MTPNDNGDYDLAALRARYQRAAHAMQSAVAFLGQLRPDAGDQTPKHLRVGVNSAMSDVGGLATLLIEKGVFTREEYYRAIAEAMEREAESNAQLARELSGLSHLTFG